MWGDLKYLIYFVLALITISCKKPYIPPAISAPESYLVVEGIINIGNELTTIHLSRTVKIGSNTTLPESDAAVKIEDDQNEVFPLAANGSGNYTTFLNPESSKKYRLRILTADGGQYLSDFEKVQYTPPID